MGTISSSLRTVKSAITSHCILVAVSKTKPVSDILECYQEGQLDFGENKVQELVQKAEELPKDIRWHMIGHLQRNKVKYLASFVHLIHGVDSFRLLSEINKRAKNENRVISCLLQVHIAEEETKFGFDQEELLAMIESEEFSRMENIQVSGLMGMATFTENQEQIRREFRALRQLFEDLKSHTDSNITMETLSMGMSGDYLLAIEEGSTMIRVGSAIFGARTYPA